MKQKNTRNSKSNGTRPARLHTCMISQYYLKKYWDWDDSEWKALGNAAATASVVYRRLTAAGLKIKEMYAITHDRDHRKMWDEYLNDYLSLPSGAHIHILIKFEDKDGATLETIASIVGIAPEYIETPKTGRYAYDNMLSYLCHIKYPDKYAYNPKNVVTVIGKYYIDYYNENHKRWMRSRYKRVLRDAKTILEEIRVRIGEGEIDLQDIILDDDYKKAYYYSKAKVDQWLRDKKHIDNLEKHFKATNSLQ